MISELTASIKDAMTVHPVLVNLTILLVAIIGGVLVNLLTRHVLFHGLRIALQRLPIRDEEGKRQLYAMASRLAYIAPVAAVYVLLVEMDIDPAYLLKVRKICMMLTICFITGIEQQMQMLTQQHLQHMLQTQWMKQIMLLQRQQLLQQHYQKH